MTQTAEHTAPVIDRRELRTALGSFATGVTVTTAYGLDGSPIGMTANSFASVSLDPPLVLWSVDRGSSLCQVFTTARGFTVNILAEDQQDLCERFSRFDGDRFEGVATQDGTDFGVRLRGALAVFDCETVQRVDGGDHVILIGQVRQLYQHAGEPLIFHQGRLSGLHAADAQSS